MKKAAGLKRKQFIVLILSVCILALMAEGVLLARTFSSKDKKGKTSKPTPEPTREPVSSVMWVPVSHVCYDETGLLVYGETYEYDEKGRLISEKKYHDEGKAYRERTCTYDKNGTKTEEWEVTDQETGKATKLVTTIGGLTIYHDEGESYQCLYDNDGYITQITKYNSADGTEKPLESVKRYYRDSVFSTEQFYAMDKNGEWVLWKTNEYRYEGDCTIVFDGSKETVYRGGRVLESTAFVKQDITQPLQKITHYSLFPDRLDCLREIYFIGDWIKEYEPADNETFSDGVSAGMVRSVECDSEGLPVKMYGGDYRHDDNLEIVGIYQYDEKNRIIYIKGQERLPGYMSRAPREMESTISYDDDDNPVAITYDGTVHRLEWNLIEVVR